VTLFSEWLNQKQSSSRVLGWRGSQWGRAWEGGTLCNCCAGSKDKHLGMAQPWDLGEPCAFCLWFWAWVGGKADLPGNSLLRQQAASLTGGELTSHSFFRSERGKLDYSSPSQLISSSSLFHITNGFLQAFKCTMLKHYILHSKPYFAPSLPFFFSIACDPLETSVFGQLKGWLGLKWSKLLFNEQKIQQTQADRRIRDSLSFQTQLRTHIHNCQEIFRGGSGWIWRKGSSPEGGQALEQASQCSGHSPKLTEFQKHLDNTLTYIWFWGGPMWSQELDSMILVGPFQLGIFYDSTFSYRFHLGHCTAAKSSKIRSLVAERQGHLVSWQFMCEREQSLNFRKQKAWVISG